MEDEAKVNGEAAAKEIIEKVKRGRKVRVKKERKPRVMRSIVACGITEDGDYVPILEFPPVIRTMKNAHAWARSQAEGGCKHIQFFRSLGTFKATPQTVMKFEVE